MVAQCAVSVVLTLAFCVWALISLIEFDVSLSLGDLSNFDSMFIAFVGKALDLPIVEVFYP